jgi:NitT/TauT family transport system permease protein
VTKLMRIRLVVVAVIIVVLELACRYNIISSYSLIPPTEMLTSMLSILRSGTINGQIISTLIAIAMAAVSAIIVGTLLAVLLHSIPRLRRAIDPVLVTYYSIPIFVFYPIFIVLFGLNNFPKILIGFLSAVVAMIASTLNGLDRVPRVMLKTGKVLKLSRLEKIVEITMPSAAPNIFNGAKLAIAHAFVGVLAAEFILSNGGLGYQIAYGYHNFDNPKMYGLMLLVLIIVSLVNGALLTWERRLRRRRGLV